MLIANNSRMVGVTNSQAMALSESPLTCRATGAGVATAAEVAIFWSMEGPDIGLHLVKSDHLITGIQLPVTLNSCEFILELAFVFEGLCPIFNQLVKRFLSSPLISDHKVVHTLLHRQKQLCVSRLLPKILNSIHRL